MTFSKPLWGRIDDRELPHFRYFPSATFAGGGSVIQKAPLECLVCEKSRDYVYVGPVYAEEDLEDSVCPWCIADGSAQEKFSAMFNPVADIKADDIDLVVSCAHNRLGDWQTVSETILEEVAHRTPGVSSWQEANWFFHCNDAAVYLGAVGINDLKRYGEQAVEAIREEAIKQLVDKDAANEWLSRLSASNSPRAYLFQCVHCNRYDGFSDCN